MREVIIASNNANKVSEISHMLGADDEVSFLTLREAGIESDPDEDADTFLGNARIKARSAFEKSQGRAVLADDSGLAVDALDGGPGVYSARFAGEDGNDEANNALLLEKLEGLSLEERTARFVCTMVLIDEDGEEHVSEGAVEGIIGFAESGSEGFGYDPLFLPVEYGGKITFAEVPQVEKNKISHRARALQGMRPFLVQR